MDGVEGIVEVLLGGAPLPHFLVVEVGIKAHVVASFRSQRYSDRLLLLSRSAKKTLGGSLRRNPRVNGVGDP